MQRALVGLAGAAMVAVMIVRYPPDPALSFDFALFVWPQADKLLAVLFTCAGLLVLDLAAYAVGRPLHRLLRVAAPPTPGLVLPERLALGLLVLADLALALAALRLLQRPLLVGLVLALAALGTLWAIRDLREAPRPGRGALVLGALAGLLLLSPLLGAWLPDYGWDGFAYHLAIPERYLFRGRIVVTPLFPHSAFPHTVEMLYLLALSLDSGALAKLLNIQFGVLAAAVAFLLAGRASRRAGLFAVVILAADPLLNWELGVAYNDLAAVLFALLAAAAFDEWRSTRGGAALRLSAIFAGACVAVRYPAAAVPVALVALLWLPLPWRGWRAKLRDSLVLAALAGLAFSPWLLRNLAATGNPFAPALQFLFYSPGREYFDPVALSQSVLSTHAYGLGHGLEDLLLLPVNLTLRVRLGFYDAFGHRTGVLYFVGLLAALVTACWRGAPSVSTFLKLAGLLTLLWFYTSQEPRYLLPALAIAAVAGGVGFDRLIPRGWTGASLLWAIPLAALLHTQWSAALVLPYRYGYALGRLPVASFEAQEPALAVVPGLRQLMAPGDRLLPIYEPRGYFYRGLDYLQASWFELMQLIRQSPSPQAFAGHLRSLGVTHVLVSQSNIARYRTFYVEGYGEREFQQDLAKLDAFIAQETTPVLADRGVLVRRLERVDSRE